MTDSEQQPPPKWLSREFLQDALQRGFNDEGFVIEELNIKPATSVGDNYMSQMFRATLRLRDRESLSVIIKSLPLGDNIVTMVHDQGFFVTETSMLSETLPRMHELLRKGGISTKLSADVYFKQGPPQNFLILEDLRVGGFTMADRRVGLDMDHCAVVMESLAAYHASSAALIREDPSVAKKYEFSCWDEESPEMKSIKEGFHALADEIESWEDTPNKYAEKVHERALNLFDHVAKAFARDESGMNVLLHADSWTNNMMFRYEEGRVTDLRFVDLQLVSYRNPALDLIYFIFTSPQDDIKLARMDDLLEIYHKKFTKICGKLGVDTNYTLQDLREDFKQRLFFAFFISGWIYPITTVPPGGAVAVDNLVDVSTTFSEVQIYRNERFVRSFKQLLPYFEANGCI